MRTKIAEIVADYEAGRLDYDQASRNIASFTGQLIEKRQLDNYWRSMSLEGFLNELALPEIAEWEQIDEQTALEMIQEALANTDGPQFERNAEALERRFRKPTGFLNQLIFHDAIDTTAEILRELQNDTSIKL
jgi:hypothetical protein